MITHKQLTLAEVFEDCQHKFDNDKYHFLALLDEAINLDEIVPFSRPNRKTSQAPALSYAQGTSAPAYFFNPDGHAPDCVLEILSGTS